MMDLTAAVTAALKARDIPVYPYHPAGLLVTDANGDDWVLGGDDSLQSFLSADGEDDGVMRIMQIAHHTSPSEIGEAWADALRSTVVMETTPDVSDDLHLTVHSDGRLVWGDGVTGRWCEKFPSVAIAVARVAALLNCKDSNWALGFADGAPDFAEKTADFFKEVTA